MATTIKAGWYGSESAASTYYLSETGEVWVVQCDDLRDCPFRLRGDMPADAIPVDDMMTSDEMQAHLDAIADEID